MMAVQDFREWQPEESYDSFVLNQVPSSSRKEFCRAIRPLSNDLSLRIYDSLFAGIKYPFHYLRTSGWMAKLLRGERTKDGDLPRFGQGEPFFGPREAFLRKEIAWPVADLVLLVCQQGYYGVTNFYATHWEDYLRWFRKGYINRDTHLVCHPQARDTILFWEDHGPFLGKRDHRKLPCPRWDRATQAKATL